MSKKKKISDVHPGQRSLFDDFIGKIKKIEKFQKEEMTEAGAFNIKHRIKGLLKEGFKKCPLSRTVAAARMSELINESISEDITYAWTAESKEEYRFPAEYLPAFIKITGNREILKIMAEMVGCYVIEGEDALLTELGRIEKQKEEIAKKERLIRQTLEQLGIKGKHTPTPLFRGE